MKIIAKTIAGVVASVVAGAAGAAVIQFEGSFTASTSGSNQGQVSSFLEESRNTYAEDDFTIKGLGSGIVGTAIASLVDGSDPGVCQGVLNCPTNDDSQYLATQGGGYFYISKTTGANTFKVASLDLAYLTPSPTGRAYAIQLIGTTVSGTTIYSSYYKLTSQFQTFSPAAAFADTDLTRVYVRGANCATTLTNCIVSTTGSNNVAGLGFAVDNIAIAVPEPRTPALWASGLFLMALIGRYKRRAEK